MLADIVHDDMLKNKYNFQIHLLLNIFTNLYINYNTQTIQNDILYTKYNIIFIQQIQFCIYSIILKFVSIMSCTYTLYKIYNILIVRNILDVAHRSLQNMIRMRDSFKNSSIQYIECFKYNIFQINFIFNSYIKCRYYY